MTAHARKYPVPQTSIVSVKSAIKSFVSSCLSQPQAAAFRAFNDHSDTTASPTLPLFKFLPTQINDMTTDTHTHTLAESVDVGCFQWMDETFWSKNYSIRSAAKTDAFRTVRRLTWRHRAPSLPCKDAIYSDNRQCFGIAILSSVACISIQERVECSRQTTIQ